MNDTPKSTTPPEADQSKGQEVNPIPPPVDLSLTPPPDPINLGAPVKTKVTLPKKTPKLQQFQNDPKFHQKSFNTNLKSTIRRAGPRGR